MNAQRLGLCCAGLHFLAFYAMALCLAGSFEPQGPMIWPLFAVLDFPVSLFYLLGRNFQSVVYLPYLIHGALGTVWWFLLPRLFLSRQRGGVW